MNQEFRSEQDPDTFSVPHFDERANASAQPVEPIQTARRKMVFDKIGRLGSLMTKQSRALAAVVILGLVTGALAGMLLARSKQARVEENLYAAESFAPIGAAEGYQLEVAEERQLDSFATELEAATTGAAASSQVFRSRTFRPRVRRHSPPRAYRVAVIRN